MLLLLTIKLLLDNTLSKVLFKEPMKNSDHRELQQ